MEPTTLLGVGLIDRVSRHRAWEVDDGPRKDQTRQHPLSEILPEDLMDKLTELAGDTKGKVTVGASLANSKEFGNKAEAFVSFSVTCDNNLATMQEVHDLVQPHVRDLVNRDLRDMMVDRDAHLKGAGATAKERVSTGPPKAKGKLAPPPGAGKKKPLGDKKIKAKPRFRR